MPADLTDSDKGILAEVLRERIAADRFPMSPRVRSLKAILAKIDASAEKPAVASFPAPKPAGQPSLLLTRKRGRRR